jgi:HPt (histidine-containing phosphotransfer) domain-containing protein
LWDRAAFDRQTGGDASLRDEIIQMFLEDCPVRVEEIRTAISNDDAAALTAAAHALKGSAAYLAAQTLRACAADLERAGRDRNLAAAPALLAALEGAVAELLPELRNHNG